MSGALAQFGIGKETVYGTPVAVTKFYEISKEDLKGKYTRIQEDALSAAYVDRADRFAVNNKGATGNLDLDVLTKGFGNWLHYMMGTVGTAGPLELNAYTHTATMGTLTGQYFTAQVGRPQSDDTIKPWTYEGGKVTDFTFTNQVDGLLKAQMGLDFEHESYFASPAGIYVLATNVPAVGAEVLSWQSGTVTVAGSTIDVSDVNVKVDNALKLDRFYINSTQNKREPVQDGKRKVTWSFKTPYDNANFWTRASSATAAGAYATLQAKWTGLTLLGTTLYPSLTIDIPVARFDDAHPIVDTPGMLEHTVTGVGLYDGSTSPVTVTYVTGDATVL